MKIANVCDKPSFICRVKITMKVMLALDQSNYSEYALKSVLERPWPDASEFLVFTVYEPYHPDFAGWDERAIVEAVNYAKENEARTKEYASESAGRLKAAINNSSVSFAVEESSRVKEAIIEKAKEFKADLIVMGSHGRTGIERFLLGSVSQAVVSHAPCSVEIIKKTGYQ